MAIAKTAGIVTSVSNEATEPQMKKQAEVTLSQAELAILIQALEPRVEEGEHWDGNLDARWVAEALLHRLQTAASSK
jgi:hypothetical protein